MFIHCTCTGVVFWSAEADAEQSSPVHVAHRAGSEATPPSSPMPPPLHMETDFNEEDCPTEVQDMHICTCTVHVYKCTCVALPCLFV